MTTIVDALDAAARDCVDAFDDAGFWLHSEDDWGWPNTIGHAPAHGRGHVQRYQGDKTEILHVVVMPPPGSARPFFGADAIVIGGTPTLVSWDWTPMVPEGAVPTTLPPRCGDSRQLPAWADDVMSTHALAARPRGEDDVAMFLTFAVASLREYLASPIVTGSDNVPAIARYVAAQRANPRLWGMLEKHIGKEAAARFIQDVLWPMPGDVWQRDAG